MRNTELAPIGSPPRVRVTRVVRVQYRLEWEYDRLETDWNFDESAGEQAEFVTLGRGRKVRFVPGPSVAYRMAAMRLIMCRRDRYAKDVESNGGKLRPVGCSLCDESPARYLGHGEYTEPEQCRYHGGDGFERLRDRLARWLRWRDERLTGSEER